MAGSVYETHIMQNSLLPFIFHLDNIRTGPFESHVSNWHENIELLYCTHGSGYVYCDGRQYPFAKGDIFVVNTNALHAFSSEDAMSYHCLIVDRRFCMENGIHSSDFHFRELIQDPLMQERFVQVVEAYAYFESGGSFGAQQVRYAVLGLLCRLCTAHIISTGQTEHSVAAQRVKEAITYIKRHMRQSMTLQDISESVGVSKCHLAREFKAYTGMTVFHTINQIRCAEAKRLIEQGSSVSSAALSCGFENLSYFSRTFKKHFGVLPSAHLQK